MTSHYADWGFTTTGHPLSGAAVRYQGFRGVCRYISRNPDKNLSAPERDDMLAHGLDIVLVWETTETRSQDGARAGTIDGNYAVTLLHSLNAPAGMTVYAATDTDTTWAKVADYHTAFNQVMSDNGFLGDVYAGYMVVLGAHNAGQSSAAWQTSAWSGQMIHPNVALYQNKYGVKIEGTICDSNEVLGPVNGWQAATSKPPTTPPNSAGDDDVKLIYVNNDSNRYYRVLKGDGTVGAATTAEGKQAYADSGAVFEPVTAKTYDWFVAQSGT